jgi:hypothetical protein
MWRIHLDKRLKGWLIGSVFVLCINLTVFIFQEHFSKPIVFLVVLLTPVAWTGLYFLAELVFRKD